MRAITILSALAAIALAQPAQAAPDPKALAYTLPDKIDWKQDRPDGPQYVLLWGDPEKPGSYAMLVRWLPHHMSHPHTHPHDRHVVVLSGTWWVGTGQDFSPDTTTPLPAGTVVTHFANQFHYDGAKDEPAILEIVGEGPQ